MNRYCRVYAIDQWGTERTAPLEGPSRLSEEETGAGPPEERLACWQWGTGPGARLNLLLPWEDAELERVTKGLPASPSTFLGPSQGGGSVYFPGTRGSLLVSGLDSVPHS